MLGSDNGYLIESENTLFRKDTLHVLYRCFMFYMVKLPIAFKYTLIKQYISKSSDSPLTSE